MDGKCQYVSPDGQDCNESDVGNGYCFWHDPDADKSAMPLAERLEKFARRGGNCQGLRLKRANLKGVNLVNQGCTEGFDLSGSDLYRANLEGAHLFNLKLRHGSLMKANLNEANLHCADLVGTNLLGTKMRDARLDNLLVGERLKQEEHAKVCYRENRRDECQDNLEQSEEIYRNLKKCAEQQGLFSLAGQFSYRELIVRRKLMKPRSVRWLFSWLMDWLCGYGEKPENTVMFSLGLIFSCAVAYFVFGVNYNEQVLQLDPSASVTDNIKTFFMALYYSVVTFTTLGYGDITPFGISRVFAVIEAFLGSFTIALFVVVVVKRMHR